MLRIVPLNPSVVARMEPSGRNPGSGGISDCTVSPGLRRKRLHPGYGVTHLRNISYLTERRT